MPLSHAVQVADPEVENVPAVQSLQLDAPVSDHVPPSHLEHALLAAPEYEPALHAVHEPAPDPENVPARQLTHVAALLFDHVPPSHLAHALLAASE